MPLTTELSNARSTAFGPLRIAYDDRVLTPRSWTELQSLWAAELAATAPDGRILELCTGAGQIGLLVLVHSDRNLVAVDLSVAACRYAEQNARTAGLEDRVEIRHQPLETACVAGETFPLIIADPPWVSGAETGSFPEDPLTAIDGGPDGLVVARACLVVIADHLGEGGSALIQVGTVDQVELLRAGLPPSLTITEIRSMDGLGVVALISRTG